MNSNTDMSIQLPTELIERAVRDKINAAIAAQLGDAEEMMKALVGNALSQKVNSRGVVSRSSYDNKHEFLEVMMGNFVRDAAREALVEYMGENKEKIKEAVKKNIAKNPSKIAKVFMDGIENSMTSTYSSSVSISFVSEE